MAPGPLVLRFGTSGPFGSRADPSPADSSGVAFGDVMTAAAGSTSASLSSTIGKPHHHHEISQTNEKAEPFGGSPSRAETVKG
jgi:hypothetical protein